MLYNKVVLTVAAPAAGGGAMGVKGALVRVAGVVKVEAADGDLAVTYDPEVAGLSDLRQAVEGAGYRLDSFAVADEEDIAYFCAG